MGQLTLGAELLGLLDLLVMLRAEFFELLLTTSVFEVLCLAHNIALLVTTDHGLELEFEDLLQLLV